VGQTPDNMAKKQEAGSKALDWDKKTSEVIAV